jgi:hypothetical protein
LRHFGRTFGTNSVTLVKPRDDKGGDLGFRLCEWNASVSAMCLTAAYAITKGGDNYSE